jgi:hypothetical protein
MLLTYTTTPLLSKTVIHCQLWSQLREIASCDKGYANRKHFIAIKRLRFSFQGRFVVVFINVSPCQTRRSHPCFFVCFARQESVLALMFTQKTQLVMKEHHPRREDVPLLANKAASIFMSTLVASANI